MIKFKPLGDRILIEPIPVESQTKSGLIIPDNAKEKPNKGIVKAVGEGTKDEKIKVKVEDVVIYGKYVGMEIHIEKNDYIILRQSDLLGIL